MGVGCVVMACAVHLEDKVAVMTMQFHPSATLTAWGKPCVERIDNFDVSEPFIFQVLLFIFCSYLLRGCGEQKVVLMRLSSAH